MLNPGIIQNNHAVRPLLDDLARVAARRRCAILLLRHLTKARGGHVHRGAGAMAFSAACRLVTFVARDPSDHQRSILATQKSNLTETPESLARRVPCPRLCVGMRAGRSSVFNWQLPAGLWYLGRADYHISESSTMPHRKTCKRHNNPGDAHALTFSCFRRQAFLSKDGSRQWLIEAIDRARKKLHFHVWAYLFEPATVYQQIEYMHHNPVRRGLCVKPEDWLWSGAADYAGVRVGPLRLDRESLPVIVES